MGASTHTTCAFKVPSGSTMDAGAALAGAMQQQRKGLVVECTATVTLKRLREVPRRGG